MGMRSTIIRFTDKKYAKSYLDGKLYLSSLSKFWDVKNNFEEQKDFCEGIAAVVPKKNGFFPSDMENALAYDVRYRIEAYKFTNLLCFFRVDIDDEKKVIQLPSKEMDMFGDMVIVINNEYELIQRVIQAVNKLGGTCVTGDIRYHRIEDSCDPDKYYNHTMTLITSDSSKNSGLFKMDELSHIRDPIHRYGCLDKYNRYANQKEWRICYLPNEHNENDVVLDVGDLSKIITIVPTSQIRKYLLEKNMGYVPGMVNYIRTNSNGNVHYSDFKNIIESIDGMCRVIVDIG